MGVQKPSMLLMLILSQFFARVVVDADDITCHTWQEPASYDYDTNLFLTSMDTTCPKSHQVRIGAALEWCIEYIFSRLNSVKMSGNELCYVPQVSKTRRNRRRLDTDKIADDAAHPMLRNGENNDIGERQGRRKLMYNKFIYRGNGYCTFCTRDNFDHRNLEMLKLNSSSLEQSEEVPREEQPNQNDNLLSNTSSYPTFVIEDFKEEDAGNVTELSASSTNTSRALSQWGKVKLDKNCRQYSYLGIEKFDDRKTPGWDWGKLANKRQLGYFLGPFYNKQSTSKTYQLPRSGNKLPETISVQFYFYEMGAWAGKHDTIYMVVNEQGNMQSFNFGSFWEKRDEGDRSRKLSSGITWKMTSMTAPGNYGGSGGLDQSHLIMVHIPKKIFKEDGYLQLRFFVATNNWKTSSLKKSGGFDNIIVKAGFPCNHNYIKRNRGWPNKPSQSHQPYFSAKEHLGHYIPPPEYRLRALGSLQYAGDWDAFEYEMEFIMHRAMTHFLLLNFNSYMGNCLHATYPGISVDLVQLPPGEGKKDASC